MLFNKWIFTWFSHLDVIELVNNKLISGKWLPLTLFIQEIDIQICRFFFDMYSYNLWVDIMNRYSIQSLHVSFFSEYIFFNFTDVLKCDFSTLHNFFSNRSRKFAQNNIHHFPLCINSVQIKILEFFCWF